MIKPLPVADTYKYTPLAEIQYQMQLDDHRHDEASSSNAPHPAVDLCDLRERPLSQPSLMALWKVKKDQ